MDGKTPYIMLASSFLAMVVVGGIYIYGAFFSPIEAEYGWSRGSISIAYSIFMAVYASMQIVAGTLYDARGPKATLPLGFLAGIGFMLCSTVSSLWQLYLFYGIVTAVGMGAMYVPSTSVAMKWFPRRKGLAAGIVLTGLGMGMLILAPLAKLFIEAYGWRLAFTYLGVIFIAALTPAALFLKNPEEGVSLKSGFLRDEEAKVALRGKLFWLIYLAFTLGSLSAVMVIIHVVPYAEGLGIPAVAAALTVSLIGISNLAGRVVMGAMLDRVGVKATLTLCFVAQAICIWALLEAKTLPVLYAVAVAFGLSYGWVALYAPTIGSLFGMKSVGSLLGVLGTSFGLGAMLGPSIAGVVFDATKSYLTSFTLGASMSLLSAFLVLPIKAVRRS